MSAVRWFQVCEFDRLQPERGVAALLHGDRLEQVAIFRTHDDELFAISNRDPVARAQVMSRGIVGTRGATPTVASPLYKQVYDLRTGVCLDISDLFVPTYQIRRIGGYIEVGLT